MMGGYHSSTVLHVLSGMKAGKKHGLKVWNQLRGHGYRFPLRDWVRALAPGFADTIYRIRMGMLSANGSLSSRSAPHLSKSLEDGLPLQYTGGPLQALLRFEDRSSMAFSIESRCPFMDYRLAEYVFSLPRGVLSFGGVLKPLIRTGLSRFLPNEIATRVPKLGFPAPDYVLDKIPGFDVASGSGWRQQIVSLWRSMFKVRSESMVEATSSR